MKEQIFNSDFWRQFILLVILGGIFIFAWQKYFEHRLQPLTAEATLKKENFLNSKRETYFTALNLINRYLANSTWSGTNIPDKKYGRNPGEPMPTETEVNTCYAKICLYTENKQILNCFVDFFGKSRSNKTTPMLLSELTNLMRLDLGYGNSLLDPKKEEYNYITITKLPMDSTH